MNYEKLFAYSVTTVLIGMAAYYHSAALAYGAVATLGFSMVKETWEKIHTAKHTTIALPEEAKRRMQDIEARVTTIEYGIKTRGF